MSNLEALEIQNVIIKMQSDIIYELITLLAQHTEVDELDCIAKINEAARLRSMIEP
jgi:hypothetical protein